MSAPRRPPLGAGDRALAWLVTGPLGRIAAFLADLAVYVWGRARARAAERRRR